MSRQFNKITFIGHLGSDPEMRYTPSGKPVTSFNVAVNHQYNDSDGETVKETYWFRCSAWGKTAEVCNQYVKKGSKVLVEGRLTPDANTGGPRVWTAQDGTPRASFEVTASTVRFLSSRGEGDGPSSGGDMGGGSFVGAPEEDIPF